MPRRSDSEFRQYGLMSQTLSDQDPVFRELSGTDPNIARSIGFFMNLGLHGLIEMDLEKAKKGIYEFKDPNIALLFDMLRMDLKVSLATSDKTNEITKMGLRMPKKDLVYDGEAD